MRRFIGFVFFFAIAAKIDGVSRNLASRNCKGILPLCTCSDRVIDCSNAGINTTEIFLNIPTYFPDLISLNMTGNRFDYLEMDLFNLRGRELVNLEKLDLRNCRIVGIHAKAFVGLPKLEELILANNSISFRGSTSEKNANEKYETPGRRIWPTENFLQPIASSLKILDLSDAFDRNERRETPVKFVANLTKLFNDTYLDVLQYLNLSSNHLTYLPPDVFCRSPVLEYLYLASNRFYSFVAHEKCLPILMELDLRSNYIRRIDDNFIDFVDSREMLKTINLFDNPFTCDCESQKFIRWLRASTKFVDKNRYICARAKPNDYDDQILTSVPEEKLRCSTDESEYLHGVYILCAIAFVGLIALLTCLVYTNRAILCKRHGKTWTPLGGYQMLGREPEVKAEMV